MTLVVLSARVDVGMRTEVLEQANRLPRNHAALAVVVCALPDVPRVEVGANDHNLANRPKDKNH